jgi:uracil-DNA glycosylase family 4
VTDLDPREELRTLAAALRVHLERSEVTGASGVPAGAFPMPAALAGDGEAAAAADRAAAPVSRPAPAAPPAAQRPQPDDGGPRVAEDGRRRLEVLAGEVRGCTLCGLHRERTQAVFARGTGSSGLCFVGEGPGADEDAQGFPFVGKAGQLLDRMIGAMGFERDEVYVCNIVKCRPPKNRKPEPDEMAACRPYLAEQLELVNPRVIVALGATAVEGLLGVSGGITRLRGNWRLYKGTIAVMPTFHPAYLLRTPEAKRDVWNDLQEVLKHLGRPVPKRAGA